MEMKCKDCRYWSEMVARSCQGGVEALCLSPRSPNRQAHTLGNDGCDYFEEGDPVDLPDNRLKG